MRSPPLTTSFALLLLAIAPCAAAQEPALVTSVNPPSLPDSTRFGYSQATVTAPGARIVHVAGQVGYDEAAADNGFEAQVDRAFDNLGVALDEAGATPADVAKITLLIVDHDAGKLDYLGRKRRAAFGETPPASTLVPVTRLYAPGVLFEIDAVAATAPER